MAIDSPPTTDMNLEGDQSPEPSPERRRPRRRTVVVAAVVLAVLVVGAGVWWFVLRDDGDAAAGLTMTEQVVEVGTGSFGETVAAEGTVAAAETEDLSFTSSGTVTAVNVAAGDSVVAGQVLATIDSADLEAAVADAEADLADAEAQLSDDSDDGASDEQLEADEAAVTTAQDALDDAEEALEGASLVATFDGLVTSVDLTVGEELGASGAGGTTVTGSGSGSGQSSATLGGGSSTAVPGGAATDQTGSTTSTQIQVVSAGRFVVDLAVDTADIDSVAVGQEVDLTISTDTAGSTGTSGFPGGFGPPGGGGFPGASAGTSGEGSGDQAVEDDTSESEVAATGTVTEVGRVADASSGVASYTVTVEFTADSGDVWVGSAATAEIKVSEHEDVTQVSSRAVTTSGGTSTVTVAVDGTVKGRTEERTVETGETSGGMVEIVSGLEPGDYVIVEMPSFGGGAGGMPGGGGLPDGGELPDGMQPPNGATFGAAQQEDGQ